MIRGLFFYRSNRLYIFAYTCGIIATDILKQPPPMTHAEITPSHDSERTKLIESAMRLFETELRDRLIEDYYGSTVLIDGRSGDYEVQSRYEPRWKTSKRLLERRPDAVVHIEHIVPKDYVYDLSGSITVLDLDIDPQQPTR